MLRPIIARNYDSILCVSCCDTARKSEVWAPHWDRKTAKRSESSFHNRCCSARMKWSS